MSSVGVRLFAKRQVGSVAGVGWPPRPSVALQKHPAGRGRGRIVRPGDLRNGRTIEKTDLSVGPVYNRPVPRSPLFSTVLLSRRKRRPWPRQILRMPFAVYVCPNVCPRKIDFSAEKFHVCPFPSKMAVDRHVPGTGPQRTPRAPTKMNHESTKERKHETEQNQSGRGVRPVRRPSFLLSVFRAFVILSSSRGVFRPVLQ